MYLKILKILSPNTKKNQHKIKSSPTVKPKRYIPE